MVSAGPKVQDTYYYTQGLFCLLAGDKQADTWLNKITSGQLKYKDAQDLLEKEIRRPDPGNHHINNDPDYLRR